MTDLSRNEPLQRLRCKLGNTLEIIYDTKGDIRGELLLFYAIIHRAIIESITILQEKEFNDSKWKHHYRFKRKKAIEQMQEAREWIMSDDPRGLWSHFTNESWEPVRDQVQKLWLELSIMSNDINALSQAARRELNKVAAGE